MRVPGCCKMSYGGCKGPLGVTCFYCCISITVHYCLLKAELIITAGWKVLNCDSWLSWLTAGLAWKHFIFLLSGQLWVLQFPVHIFCWLPVSCTASRIRWDRKRRGLSNCPSLQTAEREGQRYWKIETDRESHWRFFGCQRWWAIIGSSSFSHTILHGVFFLFFCSGVSGQFVSQKLFPAPKQVPSSVLQCRIWLFYPHPHYFIILTYSMFWPQILSFQSL